jgi:hypothetical protein
MSTSPDQVLTEVQRHARVTAMLGSIEGLLGWDERTMLPPAGGEYRAEQMTLLSGMIHDRWVDPRFGQWLDQLRESPLAADPHSDAGCTISVLPIYTLVHIRSSLPHLECVKGFAVDPRLAVGGRGRSLEGDAP